MGTHLSNRLRERREELGLSQQQLAEASALTRQSVFAIESGRSSPKVEVALRLAQILESPVEELFGQAAPSASLLTEPIVKGISGRVALAQIAGRWLSYPLQGDGLRQAADGLVVKARGKKVAVEPLRPPREAQDNVVLMGCAPALGLLADRLNARSGPGRFRWFARSSTDSLQALDLGYTHLAGVHLTDEKTGVDNLPDVRRHTRHKDVMMIALARWEVGLLTMAGNPKRIRSLLGIGRHRLVSREAGSGARRLLERELAKAGLPRSMAQHASLEVRGHLEVATAISLGAADVGIASRDAALAFGLDFQPLTEERYDLVIPRRERTDRRMERLFDLMMTAAFQRELSTLGYDVRGCGARIAEAETP